MQGEVRPWAFATVLFALAWLATLTWGLHRAPRADPKAAGGGPAPRARNPGAGERLQRALASGDLGDVEDALCAAAVPPAAGLDEVRARLSDPRQRDAVGLLQRARWAGGNGAAARASLRTAFKRGARWTEAAGKPAEDPLPPLYP